MVHFLQATSPCTSRKPRVQETASGDTPDPVVQKKNELFYNNVENFKENLRAESSVSASQGIFLWPCPSSKHITSYFGNRVAVRTGDMVKAGQQIGAVGETGISTAPHLHFEVHVNGTPVDPLQFFE